MQITSLEAVFYMALFLIPGFIIENIIRATNPVGQQNSQDLFIKYLAYSIFSFVFLWKIYSFIFEYPNSFCIPYWIVLIIVSLIGSSVIGLIFVWIHQGRFLYHIISKLGLKYVDPTPSAWDYVFSKQRSNFVLITLVNGEKIFGRYAAQSFAGENDIFLEKKYDKLENGKPWREDLAVEGLYIAKGQIAKIEFRKDGENEH